MNKILSFIKRIFNKEKSDLERWIEQGATIGKNFAYNSGWPIDSNFPWLIKIGDDVKLASNVRLLAHDASTAKIDGVRTKIGIVEIGNNVFIGADTVVLCNTRIGDNVIIGANSVVTRDCPSNGVYAGNPAIRICSFDEYAKKHQDNQNTHPICRDYRWYEWPNATIEEKMEMREKLKDTFGYL